MDGAMAGDLDEPRSLNLVERPDQFDCLIDLIEHGLGILVIGAVLDVNASVGECHDDLLESPFLACGVRVDRHRRAAAKRHQQELDRAIDELLRECETKAKISP